MYQTPLFHSRKRLDSADPPRDSNRRLGAGPRILSTASALTVCGLLATAVLPAYAASTAQPADQSLAQQVARSEDHAQTLEAAADLTSTAVVRDAFAATSEAELLRAELAAAYDAYTGPSFSDYLANPPYPNFDLSAVAAVAVQYQGVPYRFGGADPSGFDCSGLILFVYSQFGISLPHSVSGIDAAGTRIDPAAAVPGDIITMYGHNGIYLGGGMFIDAPGDGRVVVVRPIYTSDYWVTRIGI